MCRLTCDYDSMDVIDLCSDSEREDEVIEIPSEDETSANEDEEFLRELELAKQLSLADQFAKDQETTKPSSSGASTSFTLTPTVKEKFRNNFRKIKFDWKSVCDDDSTCERENPGDSWNQEPDYYELSFDEATNQDVVREGRSSRGEESSSKYIKLEDGRRHPSEQDEQFSDDLPDLEDCFIVENWNSDEQNQESQGDKQQEKRDNSGNQVIKNEVFSQKAKANLASILKRVKSFSSLGSFSTAPSTPEQDDGEDSKERHFMDFVETTMPSPKQVESKEKVEDDYEPQPSTSKAVPVIDWRIKPISLGSNGISSKRPRKCRVTKTREEGDEKKAGDIRKYLSPVKKCDSLEKQRIVEFLKPMRCEFSENSLDALTLELENLHINTIQACFDEEHPDFLQRGLQFVEDFLYNYKPCPDIVKYVLEHGLLKSRDLQIMVKSYSILMRISQRYPDLIIVDWDMLKGVMDELCIGRGLFQQDPIILWLGSHFLNLFVVTLEADLYQRDLTKNMRQSVAYKMLSYDCAYLNIRELVNWTICTITCGEYTELLDERYIQRKEEHVMTIKREDIRKILPLLQQLLALSINVSTSCKDSSKIVSSELLKSYSYLPSLQHKKLLIETMRSDLLRYRFVTLVLERYSEDCVTMCEFPMDLKIIVESLFSALPPRYGLTPPTTPQSDEEEGGQLPLGQVNTGHYPIAMVDEFVLLLYHAVQSHLHCTRRKVHRSLRTRSYYKKKEIDKLSSDDESDLKSLPYHVEELRLRLLKLTPELSRNTEVYLTRLACLSGI